MSDRDLLEAAARAGGYKPVRWTDDGTALLLEGVQEPWNALHPNPHSDCMGDALRLAVRCAHLYGWKAFMRRWLVAMMNQGGRLDDPTLATRRAIVRAAAALTRPEGGA